ncbi:MAG: NADP-dependent malic enzyme [Patescibacteria group bacterium]
MNYQEKSLALHEKYRGKIGTEVKVPLQTRGDLSLAYTPGVAGPSEAIAKDISRAETLTSAKRTVAVISDGSSVLGLGNVGPDASLPVLEGKVAIFKTFANLDAFPIALSVHTPEKIAEAVIAIAPSFGAINLEDIKAPGCFEVEKILREKLFLPVMHDDQHGTAIAVLAGLINALKVVGKNKGEVRVIINGAGAAGIATAKLLHFVGFSNIILADSKGIISHSRTDLTEEKKEALVWSNQENISGDLKEALKKADVFIGLSKGNLLRAEDVSLMNENAIVFAMANPTPEITPEEARKGGARIVATGRSDFPNQINNALVFPGVFLGLIDGKISKITDQMKMASAEALASIVENPTEENIIPDIFNPNIVPTISEAVRKNS